MPFILRVQSYCDQPLPAPQYRRFDTAGGTIGRTLDNDLVLDDPGKYVSRKHARIEFRDGDYYYADLGSNASVINDLPLGKNNEAKLNDGDRILVGDFLLVAVFEPDTRSESSVPLPSRPVTTPVVVTRPVSSVRDPDFLSDRSILYKGTLGELVGGVDPLGLRSGRVASSDPLAVRTRGAQSDHISPENQAFPASTAEGAQPPLTIPDDYDPLADTHPVPPGGASSAATAALATSPASANDVLEALFRGLGWHEPTPSLPPTELAEKVGGMLREAVSGAMAVLAARATTKHEFHAHITMLASQGNNPLKVFSAVDDALRQMLTDERPGYMSAQKAIALAFDDIKAHELATFTGMREALLKVLARFDPLAAESRLKSSGVLDAILPAKRKARLWERYVEFYAEVTNAAGEDFQRLFGECFLAAYEEQLGRVRAQIKRQQ